MKRLLINFFALAAVVAAVAQNPPTPAPAVDAANLPAATPAPQPGVIRLGLVQPKLEMGPTATPEALRTVFTQYLSGPQIEVVPITAMVPIQVEAEAKQKTCDYLFFSSLSQKQAGGRFGLLRGAQAMTNMVPVIGMAGRAGAVVAQAATATAITAAAQLSSGITAKSEVTFQYRLLAPGATSPIVANSQKVKAESDGQDVITPLVEQAATAVANALLKK